jgi:hypothetical protein
MTTPIPEKIDAIIEACRLAATLRSATYAEVRPEALAVLVDHIDDLRLNEASKWLYEPWKHRAEKAEAEVARLTQVIANHRMSASEALDRRAADDERIAAERVGAALERSRTP